MAPALAQVLPQDSGWTWALAIVGLTVTIRALLIPLFAQQVKTNRSMPALQPKIKELQEKYAHDRERLTQEQMKLWKETGTNPFASCLPILLQGLVFLALFLVIDKAAKSGAEGARGLLTGTDADSLSNSTFLGGAIADTFATSERIETKVVAIVLVVTMGVIQFVIQRQMMSSLPPDAMDQGAHIASSRRCSSTPFRWCSLWAGSTSRSASSSSGRRRTYGRWHSSST